MHEDSTRPVAFLPEVLRAAQAASGHPYSEFLRVPAMSAGLFVLPAGGADTQEPHNEDELYIVLQGQGRFTVRDSTVSVGAGSTIYVPKFAPHHFHDITQDLVIVVVFAPPEGTG
jgi:oxalate decarboxylase/phosphoglucose isomerase-like protein (cupin superfamily)